MINKSTDDGNGREKLSMLLETLRRGRRRERDFLNTKQYARVNQRHFGDKLEGRDQRHYLTGIPYCMSILHVPPL